MIFRIADDGHTDAEACRGGALRHGLGGVVGPFRMNVRAQHFEKSFYVRLVEEHNVVDGTESSKELRAGLLIEDGAAGSLKCANAAIRIDADDEDIALSASALQIADVSDVERIETTVSKDDALTANFVIGKYSEELVGRDDLGFGAAHWSGGGSRSFAANGLKKLLARDRGGAALHHDQTARDIGYVSRLERRSTAGERKSIGSKDRVARPSDVYRLIAAVDGDLGAAIAGFSTLSRGLP